MLRAADTIKRCCRKLVADAKVSLAPLEGAVKQLFTVVEAEGKVSDFYNKKMPR